MPKCKVRRTKICKVSNEKIQLHLARLILVDQKQEFYILVAIDRLIEFLTAKVYLDKSVDNPKTNHELSTYQEVLG